MQRNRKKPALPNVLKSYKRFVGNLKLFGRLHEMSMAVMLILTTMDFKNMGMGLKLFMKGKFKIFPKLKGSWTVRKMLKRVKKQEKA